MRGWIRAQYRCLGGYFESGMPSGRRDGRSQICETHPTVRYGYTQPESPHAYMYLRYGNGTIRSSDSPLIVGRGAVSVPSPT